MRDRQVAWRVVTRLVIVLLVGWLVSVALVIVWGLRDEAEPSDAIVVLGAAQWDGRPSPVLRARLEHAHRLWEKGYAPWLVVTGGVGSGDTTSEAAVGRRFLIQLGVPAERVLLEAQGRTTQESIEDVAALLTQKKLSRVLLVSDPFHMLRLDVVARSYGLTPRTSPTRTSPISRNKPELLTYVLAESFKVPFVLMEGFGALVRNAVLR